MAVIYDKKLVQLLSIKSQNNKTPLGTDAYIVFMYEWEYLHWIFMIQMKGEMWAEM